MTTATELFECALDWLRERYFAYRFFLERDVVWTVQTQIAEQIGHCQLPYKILNDYPLLPGNRRHISTDLALVDIRTGAAEVAVEFKYEPSHERGGLDIVKQKFPVVFWGEGVIEDIRRIREYVAQGKARTAYAVFIDEGGYFRKRPAPNGSQRKPWYNGVWVLYSRA